MVEGAKPGRKGARRSADPGAANPAAGAGAAARWREEAQRNLARMTNFAALALNPEPSGVGSTPREEIYRKGKAALYRYASPKTRGTPVLFVPNLGLSRPYIFDLLPGASFIEYMTRDGFDFYLLDWGLFGPTDRGLTMERCLTGVLPRVIDRVLERSGADRLALLGYCMGGTLSAAYLGMEPRAPVTTFINMAGPIDFSKAGLFGQWLSREHFDVDRVVDAFGELPVELVRVGMQLLKPTMELSSRLNLWWNLWNDEYVEGYKALNQWANDYRPMPGEFFREWVKAYYQGNGLLRGSLRYGGRPVRLETIRCPVLVVGAKEDHIVPPNCARALLDAVSSREREYVELPGGHISLIAGRSAPRHCWPRIAAWLAEHAPDNAATM
ncbi:MAG: alpha/beta fold hydrolase [bacterium]